MIKKLLFPEEARARIRRQYRSQHRSWWLAPSPWSLSIGLHHLTERQMAVDPGYIRQWVDAWLAWNDGGVVAWADVRWPRLGTHRLPQQLQLTAPADAARIAGDRERFDRASERRVAWARRWSVLDGSSVLAKHFDVFADYSDVDHGRLCELIAWLVEHPRSDVFLRQLPVAGVDTKWIEPSRRGLIVDLLRAIRSEETPRNFYETCGLRQPAHRVRLRILCPDLRRAVGGLVDLEVPLAELAVLAIAASRVLIVENLESGLALPEIPGCVAFMKLGSSVSSLASLAWARASRIVYWGDLDTHGFWILDLARGAFPDVTSVLMDESTLLAHRTLWVEEPEQIRVAELARLMPFERAVFDGLRMQRWGNSVRLEQERIAWSTAVPALLAALG